MFQADSSNGLIKNRSLKSINLSDNLLFSEHHSVLVCDYVRKKAEERDFDLWQISLRMNEVEEHLKKLPQEVL